MNDGLRISKGDTHALQFEANSFDLVIALGVVPFLHSPAAALAEMARVVKPTGHVLITSDNRFRLNHVIDPRFTPVLAPVKETVRQVARRLGWREWAVTTYRFSYASLDRLLSAAGLIITRRITLGFGPFSLFGWQPLPDALSIRLHRRLQDLADRGTPVLRATGAQHIVLASSLHSS